MIANSTETIPRKRAGSDKEEKNTRKRKKQTNNNDEYMVELPEVQPEVQEEQIPSPRYQPGGAFSSDDDVSSDDEDVIPIQSQANIDLVTFDSLNSHSVQKLKLYYQVS